MTNERELLILTFLRARQMHGYQLSDVLDTGIGRSLGVGRSTLYGLLRRLEERGWIVSHEEREGARPVRRVYDLTPDGREAFERMLRESLREYGEPNHASLVSLAHADMLPPEDVRPLLRERRARIEEKIRQLREHHEQAGPGLGQPSTGSNAGTQDGAEEHDVHHRMHSASVVMDTLARHLELDLEAVDCVLGRLVEAAQTQGD